MRCARCRRLLSAHRENALTPRRREAMNNHLAACSACRSLAESELTLVRALESLSLDSVGPELSNSISRRLAHEAPPERRFLSHVPIRFAATLGAVAAVAALAVMAWTGRPPARPRDVAAVTTVVGEVEQQMPGATSWQPVHTGDSLLEGTRLLSRSGGMVVLELASDSTISISPDSSAVIDGAQSVTLERGRLVAAPRANGLRVSTPSGDLLTRRGGTGELSVAIDEAVSVQISGLDVAWQNIGPARVLPSGSITSLNPATMTTRPAVWDEEDWSWHEDLRALCARQLLRETHPSLLPGCLQEGAP